MTFDALDFIMNEMTEEQAAEIDELPISKELQAKIKDMVLTEDDVVGYGY